MGYFTERDRALVEGLTYDPSLKPGFELLKGCLIWEDERPDGLTPENYEKLCDLWIARSCLHRGLAIGEGTLDPQYFKDAWDAAIRDGIRWPGFQRLKLSPEDKAMLDACLEDESEI